MENLAVLNFKNVLLRLKSKLIEETQVTKDSFKVDKEELVDDNDHASLLLNQMLVEKLRTRKLDYLRKVDYALKKIESGRYGVCEECEEEIELRRLELSPVTKLCVRCQEMKEISMRIYAQ